MDSSAASLAPPTASPRKPAALLGPRIRAARLRRSLTLAQVANSTGLHKGFLSRVERGQKTPSLSALLRISSALEVEIGTLLGETVDPGAITVVRRPDRRELGSADGLSSAASVFAPTSRGGITAFIVQPTAEPSEETAGHPGEEVVVVLSGTIEMIFPDRTILLEEGDACRFEGHLGHRMRRVNGELTEVLVVVAPGPG
ncbi:MAG: XRE family transcriptional regulator [Dehalococcoidia bacterium]